MPKGHVTVEEMKANAFMLQKQRQHSLNVASNDDFLFNFLNQQFFQPLWLVYNS